MSLKYRKSGTTYSAYQVFSKVANIPAYLSYRKGGHTEYIPGVPGYDNRRGHLHFVKDGTDYTAINSPQSMASKPILSRGVTNSSNSTLYTSYFYVIAGTFNPAGHYNYNFRPGNNSTNMNWFFSKSITYAGQSVWGEVIWYGGTNYTLYSTDTPKLHQITGTSNGATNTLAVRVKTTGYWYSNPNPYGSSYYIHPAFTLNLEIYGRTFS